MLSIEVLEIEQRDKRIIKEMINRVNSESAKEAIRVANELADLIIFHAKVRENAKIMMQPWDM